MVNLQELNDQRKRKTVWLSELQGDKPAGGKVPAPFSHNYASVTEHNPAFAAAMHVNLQTSSRRRVKWQP